MAAKKEVAKQQDTPPAIWEGDDTFAQEKVDATDLIIPKLMLGQYSSAAVQDGVVKAGEFYNSLRKNEVRGGEKEPVELIFFKKYKTWWEFRNDQYVRTVEVTPENHNLPWEEEDGKDIVTRKMLMNYYVLDVKDIAAGKKVPMIVTFKGTSYQAGKTLEFYKAELQTLNRSLPTQTFKLTCHREENDDGKFFVIDVEPGRDVTAEEYAVAKEWYQLLATQTFKRHDEADVPVEDVEAADVEDDVPVDVAGPSVSSPQSEMRI